MSYKTIFGLEYNDSVSKIESDPLFFFKRAIQKMRTQTNPNNFDV
jgi:hypothetical protein